MGFKGKQKKKSKYKSIFEFAPKLNEEKVPWVPFNRSDKTKGRDAFSTMFSWYHCNIQSHKESRDPSPYVQNFFECKTGQLGQHEHEWPQALSIFLINLLPSGGYSSPCIFRTSVSISRIVKKESAEDTYNLTKNMFSVTGQRKKSILRADISLSLPHIFAVCTFSSVSICPLLYFNINGLYVSFSQLKSDPDWVGCCNIRKFCIFKWQIYFKHCSVWIFMFVWICCLDKSIKVVLIVQLSALHVNRLDRLLSSLIYNLKEWALSIHYSLEMLKIYISFWCYTLIKLYEKPNSLL